MVVFLLLELMVGLLFVDISKEQKLTYQNIEEKKKRIQTKTEGQRKKIRENAVFFMEDVSENENTIEDKKLKMRIR